ncbi:MAG: cryptochrome/photolyase family protein [Actinomycetota bacterium]
MASIETVWVLGDQLAIDVGPLRNRAPGSCRVLMVESRRKLGAKRWHRQRLHVVLSSMRHFAAELRTVGYEVDYRQAGTLSEGLAAHRAQLDVRRIVAMEPMSWDARSMLSRAGVDLEPNEQFACHYDEFAAWADGRRSFKMEDFYRWQRTRFDLLMDDGERGRVPAGGRWNFDHENRERPPKDGRRWPEVEAFARDAIDDEVAREIEEGGWSVWGAPADGLWPVTRQQALRRLEEFISTGLAPFGAHEDAMLGAEWKLAHSVLACSMNLGLLHPIEIIEAAERSYRAGAAPINSVEGFVRQVIGWREYVWGVYWLWMPSYRAENRLDARRPVPPAFTGEAPTDMACVSNVIAKIEAKGYAHHIERLMVLGNLALTAGVDPAAMTDWMWASFVDGAEWVMLPNVVGMALHADGGRMATKPYASGGAYINKMSDHCRGCRFNPKLRTGPDACPYTTLYWDFLARNEPAFVGNHRMGQQLAGMRRLADLEAVRERAAEVLVALDAGRL